MKKKLPGISKEAEEKNLQEVIDIAQENLERTENFLKLLKEDMEDIWQNYEVSDKETLVLFNTAEAQYQETARDLNRRQRARKKPYFGRIIFDEVGQQGEESYYIGRTGIAKGTAEPVVIDWRAPIASVYYEGSLGKATYRVKDEGQREITLKRKRTYEVKDDRLINFYDSDVVATDELLTKYLAQNKKAVLGEIIATIQQEQNNIIRKSPRINVLVQGVAGSGKTTVAMHRISYILYNFEKDFKPEEFCIIGSNRILLNYITSVLPDLDVYGVSQMTMEQLMIRLLYEDWDKKKFSVKTLDKASPTAWKKGKEEWFLSLKDYCRRLEEDYFGNGVVVLEKTGGQLMSPGLLDHVLRENISMSMCQKAETLNEHLVAELENEMQGKNHTFPQKERDRLLHKYSTYYGKGLDKFSIYTLYEEFLEEQREKGEEVELTDNCFDVYDLAALAYLYRRVKENNPIRLASHVVIDEAQDFGMMVYEVMHFCLKDCTYTIMGDVSQNIHEGYGLSDWDGVRQLFLTGDYDCFETLKKSYRNTVEIAEFAGNILAHGSFEIYPAEPVLRHGNPVSVLSMDSEEALITQMAKTITAWQGKGHQSIAVICKDEAQAQAVREKLGKQIAIVEGEYEDMEFQTGVMVLPIFYTKGLEFDGVLVYCPTKEDYPVTDASVKLLYVAATRALHELCILHNGNLTEIIEKKATLKNRKFQTKTGSRKKVFDKPEITTKQQFLMDVKDKDKERNLRGYIGPKHIKTDDLKPKEEALVHSLNSGKEEALMRSLKHGKEQAGRGKTAIPQGQPELQKIKKVQTAEKTNTSPYAFFTMPEANALVPQGHTKVSQQVRMVQPSKEYVDFISAYGKLRVTPVADGCIRVSFIKGSFGEFEKGAFYREPEGKNLFKLRQEPTRIVMETAKIKVVVEKLNGAVQFYDKKDKLLLKEQIKEPRQLEVMPKQRGWLYFEFDRAEKLKAQGILSDDLRNISKKAYYISFGGKPLRQPRVISSKGYCLEPEGENTVLFCDTGVYGSYLYMEECSQLSYYFQLTDSLLS